MKVERRGGLSAKKMYFANRGTGMSVNLPSRFVIARWQGNGWDEPYKSRGLRTVLWAAGGEIPPADPALVEVQYEEEMANHLGPESCVLSSRGEMRSVDRGNRQASHRAAK